MTYIIAIIAQYESMAWECGGRRRGRRRTMIITIAAMTDVVVVIVLDLPFLETEEALHYFGVLSLCLGISSPSSRPGI